MKKLFLTIIGAAMLLLPFTGCQSAKLESGGAYAPANQEGQPTQAPDLAFFTIDAAFKIAYSAVDAAFQFEHDNRLQLWRLSPEIKKTLDDIRPKADEAVRRFALARAAYIANPTPTGLDLLQTILQKTQALSESVLAVLPKK